MKKILFLGGSTHQIPVLKYAREKGYYAILCDYLSDNPAQFFADAYYTISTTDKDAVLALAKEAGIDGIVAYASDPAAPIAAYVGNALNLPSNPFDSVQILAKKNLFRAFLSENGFNCPIAYTFSELSETAEKVEGFPYPVIVKPIDSSGSKGVARVDTSMEFAAAFEHALTYSRDKKVIVEEFILSSHEYMIAGDAFLIRGKLAFVGLLNSHRNSRLSPYVPIGTSYPVFLDEIKTALVINEVQRVMDLLKMNFGALNLELMFDKEDRLYIIEIGPRNGGNLIPDFLHRITGVDMIHATVEAALGNFDIPLVAAANTGFYATYVLNSGKRGIIKEINYAASIKSNIIHTVMYLKEGSIIEAFDGSNKAAGIVFLQFESQEELVYKMHHMDAMIKIVLEETGR